MDVYSVVTERIMAMLEAGTVPWKKPWSVKTGMPRNLQTKREYNGVNLFLLGCQNYESPFWLTYKQAAEKGGSVRKGEKGTPVVFWKILDSADEEDPSKIRKVPFLRYYTVFNAQQCDGIIVPEPPETVVNDFNPIDAAAEMVANMPNPPTIQHGRTKACYIPAIDTVHMPFQERFAERERYYATLFHELTHSTMHPGRLNRKCDSAIFGGTEYSKEELVAEMGCAFMCGFTGIEQQTIESSAAYINGWLQALRSDKKMVVLAATQAQKAVDYILGKYVTEEEQVSEAA